jgi:hypothetical protein
MDAAELRAMQAPIKERYKSDPSAAVITLKAKGSIDNEGIACKVETGRALAVAGLHPATGGSGLELCSGDMLLEALVACAGVTLKSVATAVEVPLKTGNVIAEGDLDFRGTLGVDKEARSALPRFASLRGRYRCAAGQARSAAETHRALLRGLPDHQERPEGFGDDEAGLSVRRPGEGRDPYAAAHPFETSCSTAFAPHRQCGVWVPAFAGTTDRCPPNSPSSSRSRCAWRSPRRSW